MTVSIVYQLTREEAAYEDFFRKIGALSEGNFKQITDNCILANVFVTPAAVRKELLPCLRPDDRLFLSPVGADCCGQLPEKSKLWLKQNVFGRPAEPRAN